MAPRAPVETVGSGARLVGVSTPPRRRRLDVKLLVASFAIALGVGLALVGVATSVTGRDQQRLPPAIEAIEPISGATQVPQQSRIFVDLADGYRGVLVIDGVELPTVALDEVAPTPPGLGGGDQVEVPDATIFEPGNSTLTYVPREGGLVGPFSTGTHDATVIFWPVDEGREASAASFAWRFYVV